MSYYQIALPLTFVHYFSRKLLFTSKIELHGLNYTHPRRSDASLTLKMDLFCSPLIRSSFNILRQPCQNCNFMRYLMTRNSPRINTSILAFNIECWLGSFGLDDKMIIAVRTVLITAWMWTSGVLQQAKRWSTFLQILQHPSWNISYISCMQTSVWRCQTLLSRASQERADHISML